MIYVLKWMMIFVVDQKQSPFFECDFQKIWAFLAFALVYLGALKYSTNV
jgi:hypothetical protein